MTTADIDIGIKYFAGLIKSEISICIELICTMFSLCRSDNESHSVLNNGTLFSSKIGGSSLLWLSCR